MPDLEVMLRSYAERLDEQYPQVKLEEIVGRPTPRAAPLRWLTVRRGLAIAAASAAVVLILVGGLALLIALLGEEEPPVVTEPPAPAEASEWPLGLVLSDRTGIRVVPFESPEEAVLLQSDEFFEGITWAIPDRRGGMIFQHSDATPAPWPPGAVLWLRAGAVTPEVLVPPAGPVEHASWPKAGILPIGVADSGQGHALFVYSIGSVDAESWTSRIMAADLDAGGLTRQIYETDRFIDPVWGDHPLVAGDTIALIDRDWDTNESDRCVTVMLIGVDDGSPVPAAPDCLPSGWMTLAHDGRSMGVLGTEVFTLNEETLPVTIFDPSTGEILEEATVDVRGYQAVDLTSSPGGWLVSVDTPNEVRLLRLDGTLHLRVEKSKVPFAWPEDFWFFTRTAYHHPLDLAPGASLGSGSGEVPCRPSDSDLPSQDIPAAVAATRRLLFDLASACDYMSLAALAREHSTRLFVEGYVISFAEADTTYPPLSEDRLVRVWIADGRSGALEAYGAPASEPLGALAALLATTPIYVEEAAQFPETQPDREGPMWVWPRVFVEPSDEGWREVAGEEPHPPAPGGGYVGYRVGISPDGSWAFFVAGDFSGTADD